jgi:uncharacterized protein YqgC (DUF456 family)
MSTALIGTGLGAMVGLLSAVILWSLAGKVKARNNAGSQSGAAMLKGTAIVLFVLLAAMGLFIGPLVLGA